MQFSLKAQIILFGCMLNKVSATRSESETYSNSGTYDFETSFKIQVQLQSKDYEPKGRFKRFIGKNKKSASGTLDLVTSVVTIDKPGDLENLQQHETFTVSVKSTNEKGQTILRLSHARGFNVSVQMSSYDKDEKQFKAWRSSLPIEIPVTFNTDQNKHEGSGCLIFSGQNRNEIPQLEVHELVSVADISEFRHDEGQASIRNGKAVMVFKYDITRVNESEEFMIEPKGELKYSENAEHLKLVSIHCKSDWEWTKFRLVRHLQNLVQVRFEQNREELVSQQQRRMDSTAEQLFERFLKHEKEITNAETADLGDKARYHKTKRIIKQSGFGDIDEMRALKKASDDLGEVEVPW